MLFFYPDGPERLKLAKKLISYGCDLDAEQIRNKADSTILHIIVKQGNPKRLGLLLDLITLGANIPDELLHLAAEKAPVSFLKALFPGRIIPGINSRDHRGYTPVQAAAFRTDPEVPAVLSFLASKGGNMNDDLFKLVSSPEVAACILDLGADVNHIHRDGSFPLWIAVMSNRTEVAKVLLERGADVNQRDPQANTCLHIMWTKEMCNLLMENNPSLTVINSYGQSVLDALSCDEDAEEDFVEMAKSFFEKCPSGFLETRVGPQGSTALDIYVDAGIPGTAK